MPERVITSVFLAMLSIRENLFVLNQFINFVSNYTIQLWA